MQRCIQHGPCPWGIHNLVSLKSVITQMLSELCYGNEQFQSLSALTNTKKFLSHTQVHVPCG